EPLHTSHGYTSLHRYLPRESYRCSRRQIPGLNKLVTRTWYAYWCCHSYLGEWRKGRRARFRSVCAQGREGSSPSSATIPPCRLPGFFHRWVALPSLSVILLLCVIVRHDQVVLGFWTTLLYR